jgi:hypothetical protein
MLEELVYTPQDDQRTKIGVEKVVVILLLLDQEGLY